MAKRYILAHDLGTTGDKAVIVDVELGLAGSAFAPYSTTYPLVTWAEQDPEEWWMAVTQATREVFRTMQIPSQEIAAVAFSGQMMGCVAVDAKGLPLRPAIIWADQRAVEEAQTLADRIGLAEGYRILGHRIGPAYSAAKMMWLKHHEPEIYSKTHKFLQAKDFIVLRLTGKWVTDYSDACGTNLFDIHRRQWSEPLVAGSGIDPEKLPPAFPSPTVVGEVTKEAAEATGLAPGTPVVLGGGDGVCATAGAGVFEQGVGYVYLGSSAWIAVASPKPCLDPKMRTFTWIHLDPARYSPNGTMHNAGSSLEWAQSVLGGLEGQAAAWLGISPYEIIEKEVGRIPPGAEGVIFLPYLMGERSPHWNPMARGAFLGLTRKHTRAHLLRAVFEGIAFNLRLILEALREIGAKVDVLRVLGGGAQSAVWVGILADVLATPIEVTDHPLEATALGAAMTGAVGAGLFADFSSATRQLVKTRLAREPDPHALEHYAELAETFREVYSALVPAFDRLAQFQLRGGEHGTA